MLKTLTRTQPFPFSCLILNRKKEIMSSILYMEEKSIQLDHVAHRTSNNVKEKNILIYFNAFLYNSLYKSIFL